MATIDKSMLWRDIELERKLVDIPVLGEHTIQVEVGLNGLELFKRDRLIDELQERFKDDIVIDGNKLDQWIVYHLCMLAIHVQSPRLTVEEWALVFYTKPVIYNCCVKAVMEYTLKVGAMESFLSKSFLEPELNKD